MSREAKFKAKELGKLHAGRLYKDLCTVRSSLAVADFSCGLICPYAKMPTLTRILARPIEAELWRKIQNTKM
jgi:hypothetical protein